MHRQVARHRHVAKHRQVARHRQVVRPKQHQTTQSLKPCILSYIFDWGDFNTRTDTLKDNYTFSHDANSCYRNSTDGKMLDRQSQDNTINGNGKSLIDMCSTLGLYVVHGRFG